MEKLSVSEPRSVPLIETREICKSYRGLVAVASVDFDLNAGEVHGLVGANGAGKSTFTKILTGAIRPIQATSISAAKRLHFEAPAMNSL